MILSEASIAQLAEKCNSCSIFLQFFFRLPLQRQADGDHRTAAVGVADVELSAVEMHDLITDRQTNAAAPRPGGALVELLLHIGQLRLGDAGAEVPDGDDIGLVLLCQTDDDAFAGAAVLGGVVQHVAKHLLQPLRVAGDGLVVQRLVAGVLQRDAVLPEQLPVGVDRVLQLRLQVGILHL